MEKGSAVNVGIVIGSDSDLPVVKETADILDEFGVSYEIKVLSAHRTPEQIDCYIRMALKRKIEVIIAGAGGAAHLAGVIASKFPLPVIGIPIKTSALNGLDSLFSIVQMPPGVPVATVGINAAKNAGLLAVSIIAVSDSFLLKRLILYRKELADSVIRKSAKLEKIGYKQYLEELEIKA